MAKVLEYQLHTGIFLMSMGGDRVDIYTTSDQTVVYSVPVVTGSTYTVTMLEIGNRFGVAFSTIDPTTITQSIENGATRITFNGPSIGQEIPYTAAEDGWILIYVSNQNERPLISVVTDGVGGDGSESESVLKIVNATQLDAALKSTADAIRSKTGGTGKIPWSETEGFKSAVEGISGISVPDGTNVTFGNEKKTVTTTTPEGKAYFNDVLLPEIPADVLAEYPYAWIRNDSANGNYNLVVSKTPWYYNGTNLTKGTSDTIPYYSIPISNAETATEWGSSAESNLEFGLASNRTVMWSNHDIPNGAATATAIYFKGSEPITELIETGSLPADRLEAYAILGADLNAIGAITQKMAGKSALMTVADMIYCLNRVQYIPQGNAASSFSLLFNSGASGILPNVQKGTATSAFSLSFTASAAGELQEA